MGADGEDPHQTTSAAMPNRRSSTRLHGEPHGAERDRLLAEVARGRCAAGSARVVRISRSSGRAASRPRARGRRRRSRSRVEDDDAGAIPRASRSTSCVDDLAPPRVALGGRREDDLRVDRVRVAAGELEQRRPPRAAARASPVRAYALPPAACSNGPSPSRGASSLGERQVADLARRAVRAAVEPAADEQAAADAVARPGRRARRRCPAPRRASARRAPRGAPRSRPAPGTGTSAAAAAPSGRPSQPPSCGASVSRPGRPDRRRPGVPTPTAWRLARRDARGGERGGGGRLHVLQQRLRRRRARAPARGRRSVASTSPFRSATRTSSLFGADVDARARGRGRPGTAGGAPAGRAVAAARQPFAALSTYGALAEQRPRPTSLTVGFESPDRLARVRARDRPVRADRAEDVRPSSAAGGAAGSRLGVASVHVILTRSRADVRKVS